MPRAGLQKQECWVRLRQTLYRKRRYSSVGNLPRETILWLDIERRLRLGTSGSEPISTVFA
jgi:hypothetical protein